MFGQTKLPHELKKALDQAQRILDTRATIEEAIRRTVAAIPPAEQRLQQLLEAMGSAEADAALMADPGAKAERPMRDAVAQARLDLECLEARVSGLRRKLAEQDDSVITASEALELARGPHCEAIAAEFREKYLQGAQKFVEVLREGFGLSEGLGIPLASLAGVRNPQDPTAIDAAPLFEERLTADGERQIDWQANVTARQAFERVGTARTVSLAINKQADSIRATRKAQEETEAASRGASRPLQPFTSQPLTPPLVKVDPLHKGTIFDPAHETAGMTPQQFGDWLRTRLDESLAKIEAEYQSTMAALRATDPSPVGS